MYTYIDFSNKIISQGSPLFHKQWGLIHQIGVQLGCDLKIDDDDDDDDDYDYYYY